MVKLLSITPDVKTSRHKYVARFLLNNGQIKYTKFGAKGYDDFTLKATPEDRNNYWQRHAKDLDTDDFTRAGFLSLYILWGHSKNINDNIEFYRAEFNI